MPIENLSQQQASGSDVHNLVRGGLQDKLDYLAKTRLFQIIVRQLNGCM